MPREVREALRAIVDGPSASFREAMSRFASGVTIVTTVDEDGVWKGFTASAFCSLSLDPPLVLVCQARTSSSYDAFVRSDRFLVNILGEEHRELALRFAHSGGDKFAGGPFRAHGATGLPVLPDALAVVCCEVWNRHDGGDHDIYIGAVRSCTARAGAPMLHFDSGFWELTPAVAG
jgi:flavin reductase ActVB